MRNWSKNQITLVLIRHGETEANKERRYLGKTDEPLSEDGKAMLMQTKERGSYPEVDYLFCSPMKRCRETAELLYPGKEFTTIPEWEEMDFGEFEGKNYFDLQGDIRYQAWIDSNGTLPFPGGESRAEFIGRCSRGLFRMLEYTAEPADEKGSSIVGLIVHGGTIMSLLSEFCGGEYFDYQIKNGQGYRCILKVQNGQPVITVPELIFGRSE